MPTRIDDAGALKALAHPLRVALLALQLNEEQRLTGAFLDGRTAGSASNVPTEKPVSVARQGRSRPSPASDASTKPAAASLRRCQEQLEALEPTASAQALAVAGPAATRCASSATRRGWASAFSAPASSIRVGISERFLSKGNFQDSAAGLRGTIPVR